MNALTKHSQVNIRLHRQELRRYVAAARKQRKHLSQWFRDLADDEVERQRQNRNGRSKK